MNKPSELRYVSRELELVAENLAELTDAIHVYQYRGELYRNIYQNVEQLQSEAFKLHDQIATLAEKEELEEKFKTTDLTKENRAFLDEVEKKLNAIIDIKGGFDTYDLYTVLTGDDPRNCVWPYNFLKMVAEES